MLPGPNLNNLKCAALPSIHETSNKILLEIMDLNSIRNIFCHLKFLQKTSVKQ